jgi:hypothetical protein
MYPSSGQVIEQSAGIMDGTIFYPALPVLNRNIRSTNTSDVPACDKTSAILTAGPLRRYDLGQLKLTPPFAIQ